MEAMQAMSESGFAVTTLLAAAGLEGSALACPLSAHVRALHSHSDLVANCKSLPAHVAEMINHPELHPAGNGRQTGMPVLRLSLREQLYCRFFVRSALRLGEFANGAPRLTAHHAVSRSHVVASSPQPVLQTADVVRR
jgi:hypothetical protein